MSKLDVEYELRKRKSPPDAWEQYPITGVLNDRKCIEQFLYVQPQSFAGVGAGGLGVYIAHQKL